MNTKEILGMRIKELRQSAKMTQEILSEKIGITSKYLSSIERGKENPTLDTLINISESLNVTLSEIFECSHLDKNEKELIGTISNVVNKSDFEKLKLTLKILKALN